MTFEQLRTKHPRFIYRGFSRSIENGNLRVVFDFFLEPDITFSPEVIFPDVSKERLDLIGEKVLDNIIFNLGLIEMISYWKATCSPEIVIDAGFLDEDQKKFWKDLLIQGLGEFFYINKIDFTRDDLVKFTNSSSIEKQRDESRSLNSSSPQRSNNNEKSLVLVGGGKDSSVTMELFQELKKNFTPFLLNPTTAALDITKVSGVPALVIKRIVDTKLFDLSGEGYLNGHTPFSAYLAFLGVLAGVLYDYKNIVVSNEASSNEGNIEYMGKVINHQYSKTFDFETKFRDYSVKYLSKNSNYYSFLRPLTELQIAKLFSKMEKYHPLFRSCNKGSKTNSWCGSCAKCLFAFLILKPYLGEKIDKLFGNNLLEVEELKPMLSQLLREENSAKPFDCVGLVDETKAALYLIDQKKYSYFQKYSQALEKQWNNENNLPKDLADFLRRKIDES